MTVILRPEAVAAARDVLEQAGETVSLLGTVTAGTGRVDLRG